MKVIGSRSSKCRGVQRRIGHERRNGRVLGKDEQKSSELRRASLRYTCRVVDDFGVNLGGKRAFCSVSSCVRGEL